MKHGYLYLHLSQCLWRLLQNKRLIMSLMIWAKLCIPTKFPSWLSKTALWFVFNRTHEESQPIQDQLRLSTTLFGIGPTLYWHGKPIHELEYYAVFSKRPQERSHMNSISWMTIELKATSYCRHVEQKVAHFFGSILLLWNKQNGSQNSWQLSRGFRSS